MPEKKNIYTQTIHPLISMAVPFLFIVAATVLTVELTILKSPLTILQYAIILGSGFSRVILKRIFYQERIDKLNIIREFILMTAAVYALFSVLKTGSFAKRFYPDINNIYPALLTILQWGLTFRLHQLFHNREMLLDVIEGKEGFALIKELRNSAELAKDAYTDSLRFKPVFILLSCLLFGLLIITTISPFRISWWAVSWTGLFILAVVLSTMAINLFTQEYANLGEGFNFSRTTQKQRFNFALLFATICIILALSFANYKALFKLPEIKLPVMPTVRQEANFLFPTYPPLEKFLDKALYANAPSLDLGRIFKIIAPVLLTILIIFIIVILVLPFFSRDFFRWLRRKRIIRFLTEKAKAFLNFLKNIGSALKALFKKRNLLYSTKNSKQLTQHRRPERISPGKQREINRVVRLFIKLLHWGKKRGIPYYSSQTACEYIAQLVVRYPLEQEALAMVVIIFEEAVFSSHILSKKTITRYKETIMQIMKMR